MANRSVGAPTSLRQPHTGQTLRAWWRQIRSPASILLALPAAAGIALVYLAAGAGWRGLIAKPLHEALAIALLGVAVGIFFIRAWRHRLKLDYLLLITAVNFLCREIHFEGTDNAVVVVAVIVAVLCAIWREQVFETLGKAPLVRLALTGAFLTYLLGQLIQRRVFSAGRIPLLPDEALLHVPLEEISENIAHLYFILIGIACFVELRPGGKRKKTNHPPHTEDSGQPLNRKS
jgi:hypothetical protein